MPETCELCRRAGVALTRHHLIPQARHAIRRNKKVFARDDVRDRIAMLCRPCHSNVHACLGLKELERDYNTIEALAAHPMVARFSRWIAGKPPDFRPRIRAWNGD